MSEPPVPQRGDIFWAELGAPAGSEPGNRRPVVVLQSDGLNRSALATVVVAAITSNTTLADYPGNVFLPRSLSGLARDSVVNVTAIATVDRAVLVGRVGQLPRHLVDDIGAGIRLVLSL